MAPAQRQAHTRALVRALASWAAQQQEMSGVIKLPFSPQEEQVGRADKTTPSMHALALGACTLAARWTSMLPVFLTWCACMHCL